MDENGEGLRVEAPKGSGSKKAVERGSEAVLEFLRDTEVRCWSLAVVARAPRVEQVREEERAEGEEARGCPRLVVLHLFVILYLYPVAYARRAMAAAAFLS